MKEVTVMTCTGGGEYGLAKVCISAKVYCTLNAGFYCNYITIPQQIFILSGMILKLQ
jgi:hypothetical protein